MVPEIQQEATYQSGINGLLRAAYRRDFPMLEMGKCKTQYRKFSNWYSTLDNEQSKRVDELLEAEYKKFFLISFNIKN